MILSGRVSLFLNGGVFTWTEKVEAGIVRDERVVLTMWIILKSLKN